MKIILHLSFVFCFFNFAFCQSEQCRTDYLFTDCYPGNHLSLLETIEQKENLYEARHGYRRSNRWHDENIAALKDSFYGEKIEALYKEVKEILIDKIGQKNFCERIQLFDFRAAENREFYGHIEMTFYYLKSDCENNHEEVDRMKFEFKETSKGSGEFILKQPESFPDCQTGDCEYKFLNPEDINYKAIKDGRFDGTEYFHKERVGLRYYQFQHIEAYKTPRIYLFDLKNGELVKDSLDAGRRLHQQINWDTVFTNSDAIVDASYVETRKFKMPNGRLYSNHFYKVHHVLKGQDVADYIYFSEFNEERGCLIYSYYPREGERKIFTLIKPEAYDTSILTSVKNSSEHQLWYLKNQPPFHAAGSFFDYYTKSFDRIKSVSGEPIRAISEPELKDQRVIDWLAEKGKTDLANKEGLVVYCSRPWFRDKYSKIVMPISISSSRDFTNPTELKFQLEYDPTLVGSFVARNGVVEVARFQKEDYYRRNRPYALFNENYELSVKDVSANKIEVSVKAKNHENLSQFFPISFKDSQEGIPRAALFLKFKRKEDQLKGTFYTKMIQKPFDSPGSYLSVTKKKEIPYKYMMLFEEEYEPIFIR